MIPSPSTANAILLVGHPNVGKSVLFHRLTGAYVNVSNYPGTTVEVTRASARFDREAMLLDTPGVLALPSRSDDERATMRALLNESSRCLVQVSYAIGVAEPTSIMVETYGTGKVNNETLTALVRKHFDLRPKGIVNMLDLLRPIYQKTAAYGHFGRDEPEFSWEATDRANLLRSDAGL